MSNSNQIQKEKQLRKEKPKSSYTKGQRIVAMAGVVFLLGLYLVTLIAGITTSNQAPELFQMCVGSSILLPVMFWLYIRFAKLFSDRDRQRYLAVAEDRETVEQGRDDRKTVEEERTRRNTAEAEQKDR